MSNYLQPMDSSMPGFSFFYYHPEFPQIHVHWVSDVISPFDPLKPNSPFAFNLSQHQGLCQSQLFTSGGQSIGPSVSTSVFPMNIQGWFPSGWTGLISLQFKRVSRIFCKHNLEATVLWCSAFFMVQLSHPYMTTGKTIDEVYGPLSTRCHFCFLM